jgi:hypothetical protein
MGEAHELCAALNVKPQTAAPWANQFTTGELI